MEKVTNVVNKITRILVIVSYVAFLFIMLITVADIIMRLITNSSILGAYELVEKAMVCGVFAAFAFTQSEHGHVQITLVIAKFPKRLQFFIMMLNNLLSVVATIMVAYGAYRQSIVAFNSHYTTGVLYIPTYPFYYVEIVAMAILVLAFLLDAVKCAIGIFKPDSQVALMRTWSTN